MKGRNFEWRPNVRCTAWTALRCSAPLVKAPWDACLRLQKQGRWRAKTSGGEKEKDMKAIHLQAADWLAADKRLVHCPSDGRRIVMGGAVSS